MTTTPRRDRVSRLPEMLMLGVSLAIVLVIAFFSYRGGESERIAKQQRKRALEIVKVDDTLLSMLKDAETGQRGFLLTGRERYLEPYNDALAAIPQLLKRFRTAIASDPDLAAGLRKIESPVAEKLAELRTTIEWRRANKLAEAMTIVDSDHGKKLMDEIRVGGADIEQGAENRLAQYDANAEQADLNQRRVSIGGGILLAAFLALSTVTIFRGMTRRDELFKRTYAGEKLLGTTLSGIADGVIATDVKGRITFINPVARKLTGWTESEAIGAAINQVFTIVNETTRAAVENPLEKALAHGVPSGLANHTNLISRTGEDTPIDDSAAPLRDEHGNLIGAVIVFRDISAKRCAERQLQNVNAELQQFVDAAAHDLRSPLNSVNSMAQLLAHQFQGELGAEGKELIGYITGSIERMRRLLDDLMAFARASHFDETTALPISLDGPLRLALENLKADMERTAATVTFEPLPPVVMHQAHALQVFQNLIGNAVKYHGAEPPRIHVRAAQKDSEWCISITDNCIGIEPEYVDQIFKPFKRLHGDDYPGSGIGLATCQRIVKGYGGRIWVTSVPGEGSTFFFTLPATAMEVGKATSTS